MMLMLKSMKRPRIAPQELLQPLIFLTVLLSGCAGLKKFPTDKLYEFDPKVPTCAEYQITDFEHLKFKHVKDIPFDQCQAIFGFLDKDIGKVLQWGEDSIKYGHEHCK